MTGAYPVIADNGGMKLKFKKLFPFLSLAILLFCWNQSFSEEFSSKVKLSYIFLDQSGNRYNLPELYNVYSGFSLEKLYLTGTFKTNSTIQVSLSNVNLDNRNLSLSLQLPDLFSLRATHQKSRFVFDKDGDIRSFRTRTAMGITLKPVRFLKFSLDYSQKLKEGSRLGYVEENTGTLGTEYDQMIQNGKAGVQLKWGKRYLAFSHRILQFNSDLSDTLDRTTNRTEISLNTPLPANISVSLRYMRDESKLENKHLKLNTDLLAGTILQRVSKKILAAFKFSFQRSDNLSTYKMTDIARFGPWFSYRISKRFETELGYEYHDKKDPYGTVNTHSILLGAKARPVEHLLISGLYRFKTRKDPDFSTLTGEYDEDNKLLKLRYEPVDRVNIQMRYQEKIRENKDIDTKAESQGLYSNIYVRLREECNLTFYFSLLDWDFHNFQTDYQTSNRTYGLTINSKPMESLTFKGGASYLELSQDLDIKKYSFSFGVSYQFLRGLALEADFQRFKYEDMIASENDLDANVFKIGVLKSIDRF